MSLPSRNTYLEYKQNTNALLRWIVTTASNIPDHHHHQGAKESSSPTTAPPHEGTNVLIRVSTLLSLSQRISAHLKPATATPRRRIDIPARIYKLFRTVIEARKATSRWYQNLSSSDAADPEIAASNERHRVFNEALDVAFDALGGTEWERDHQRQRKNTPGEQRAGGSEDEIREEEEEQEEKEKEVEFVNRFDGLDVDDAESADEEEEEEEEEEGQGQGQGQGSREESAGPCGQIKNSATGKGGRKNNKKKGKSKGKGCAKRRVKTQKPRHDGRDNLATQNYRLMDEDGDEVELRIAVVALFIEMLELRERSQNMWIESLFPMRLEYKIGDTTKKTTTLAGVVNKIMISQIKQSEQDIAVDFPSYSSTWESLAKVLSTGATGRNTQDLQNLENFKMYALGDPDDFNNNNRHHDHHHDRPDQSRHTNNSPASTGGGEQKAASALEFFGVNIYRDIVAFITDYRKHRNGKPTKQMQKQIIHWDPYFKLSSATEEERLKWRTSFTINWLYDLVNTHLHGIGIHPEQPRPRGMARFAADIATIAMQKQSDPISLLPHHVFTMQLALDTTTIAHGWQCHTQAGSHILHKHAHQWPWVTIPAFEAVLNFTIRPQSVHEAEKVLLSAIDRDARRYDNPNKNIALRNSMGETVGKAFELGSSGWYFSESSGLRSRFEKTEPAQAHAPRGSIFLYSPFACGAGLVEVASDMFDSGLQLWDKTGAPLAAMHLYNFLKQAEHLPGEIPVFETLLQMFGHMYFSPGGVPEQDFAPTYMQSLGALRRRGRKGNEGICMVRELMRYDWVPEKVPDESLPLHTEVAHGRLYQQQLGYSAALPIRKDVALGVRVVAENMGKKNAPPLSLHPMPALHTTVITSRSSSTGKSDATRHVPTPVETPLYRRFKAADDLPDDFGTQAWMERTAIFATPELYLHVLEKSMGKEINGVVPYLGLNYFYLCGSILFLFDSFVDELERLGLDDGRVIPGLSNEVTHERVMRMAFSSCTRQDMKGLRCDSEILQLLGEMMWERMGATPIEDYCYW